MAKRKIIKIDEAKCNGCGLCIPDCPEGALKIIDGKARLISDLFCDGLGACLGKCPQGAIAMEEREAAEYDEKKAMANIAHGPCGCPGAAAVDLRKNTALTAQKSASLRQRSELLHWPVQIKLVSSAASFLKGADLLIAADCVPFAYANFHQDLLKGKILLVGCPKLDDLELYREKITQILQNNEIKSVTYAHMEVPCCFGLVGVIQSALANIGKDIPFKEVTISIRGERL